MTIKEKNTPNIHQWPVIQFNDRIAEKCQVFLYFSAIGMERKAPVDKHFIFPDPAATAEEAVGEAGEEDGFW